MQPLTHLTSDYPYVVIEDYPEGFNIQMHSIKPQDYDPIDVLKKIYDIVKHNIPYVYETELTYVRCSGQGLWEKLRIIATEIVSFHSINPLFFWMDQNNQALENQVKRINALINVSILHQDWDSGRKHKYVNRSESHIKYSKRDCPSQRSAGTTLIFKL